MNIVSNSESVKIDVQWSSKTTLFVLVSVNKECVTNVWLCILNSLSVTLMQKIYKFSFLVSTPCSSCHLIVTWSGIIFEWVCWFATEKIISCISHLVGHQWLIPLHYTAWRASKQHPQHRVFIIPTSYTSNQHLPTSAMDHLWTLCFITTNYSTPKNLLYIFI